MLFCIRLQERKARFGKVFTFWIYANYFLFSLQSPTLWWFTLLKATIHVSYLYSTKVVDKQKMGDNIYVLPNDLILISHIKNKSEHKL